MIRFSVSGRIGWESLYEIIGALYRRIEKLEQEKDIFEQSAHDQIDASEKLSAYIKRLEGAIERLGPPLALDVRLVHIPLENAERVIHAFTGGSDGVEPYAGLTRDGKLLYGTTLTGGGSVNCAGGPVEGTALRSAPPSRRPGARRQQHGLSIREWRQ